MTIVIPAWGGGKRSGDVSVPLTINNHVTTRKSFYFLVPQFLSNTSVKIPFFFSVKFSR